MCVLKFTSMLAWTDVSKCVLCVQHPRSLVTGSSVCAFACLYVCMNMNIYIYIYIYIYIQGVPRVKVTTSGECSLC